MIPVPISVVIITYNEEKNIDRCLESVKDIADEIVVIDSFSTDLTKTICIQHDVKFIEHAFEGYIEQKNWALTQAAHPYVLSLDADEALSDTLKKSVLEAKNNWTHDAWYFNRMTNYCGKWIKHGRWYPDRKLRLWDIRKGRWGGYNPHDKVIMNEPATKQYLKGDILHYSYYSINQHVLQANQFTDITSVEAFKKKKKYSLLKTIFYPPIRFIRDFFISRGFLDGFEGFVVCAISAYASYLKCIKVRQLYKEDKILRRRAKIKNLIISRIDSIGDVVLTLPMTGIVKKRIPGCKIHFLGRSYTKPLADASKNIDNFLNWDEISQLPENERIGLFKKINADAIIHVFPNKKIAKLAHQANIPIRIGTGHRVYNWLYCNNKVEFSRKNSLLHEAQLNLKLLYPLKEKFNFTLSDLPLFYGLSKIAPLPDKIKSVLSTDKKNIILHPKSKGSAREWGLENYSKLISLLPKDKYKIFITGTETEGREMQEFLKKNEDNVLDMTGKLNLTELISFINEADGMVCASTGPLHIAAALGKVAIGLYAPIRPMHPGRWSPMGIKAAYLVLDKSCNDCRKSNDCSCIKSIKPEDVLAKIAAGFLN
jgi:heptosyltransferase III